MNTLTPLFEASLRGALLIGLLVALRAPLRRFVGSPWLCALWLVVLVRLLLPGSIQSSWSIFNWWPETKVAGINSGLIEARVSVLPVAGSGQGSGLVSRDAAKNAQGPASKASWLLILWAAGATVATASLGWRVLKTSRMARSTEPATDSGLLAAFESIPPNLRGNVTLRQVINLDVPALVGLRKPQIWMPTTWLGTMSEEELRHVLLHELGHAKRGDLWVQWFFAVAQCVHWFNPAVWLAARLAHADRELACDAWVLRHANLPEPEQYGATLVKAAQLLRSRWHLPPAAVTMAMSKASLFSRVRSIGQFEPVARWRAVLGSLCVALMLGSLATDRVHAQSGAAPLPASPVAPARAASALPAVQGSSADGALANGNGILLESGRGIIMAPHTASPSVEPASSPRQVLVEARFFEIPEANLNTLGFDDPSSSLFQVNGMLTPSDLHTLLARIGGISGAELLSAPRLVTRSGQRGIIEIVKEFRYPTKFEPDPQNAKALLPTEFETRNVGITLEAEPKVSADESSVELQLAPQIVEIIGFMRPGQSEPTPVPTDPSKKGIDRILNVTIPNDPTVQPVFSTRKVTTSVDLQSGSTVILGGMTQNVVSESEKGTRSLFILVTVRVIPNASASSSPSADGPVLSWKLEPGEAGGLMTEGAFIKSGSGAVTVLVPKTRAGGTSGAGSGFGRGIQDAAPSPQALPPAETPPASPRR